MNPFLKRRIEKRQSMYDKDMLLEVLQQTLDAIERVNKRFESVDSVEFLLGRRKARKNLMPFVWSSSP